MSPLDDLVRTWLGFAKGWLRVTEALISFFSICPPNNRVPIRWVCLFASFLRQLPVLMVVAWAALNSHHFRLVCFFNSVFGVLLSLCVDGGHRSVSRDVPWGLSPNALVECVPGQGSLATPLPEC